jgi:hypothetical protein
MEALLIPTLTTHMIFQRIESEAPLSLSVGTLKISFDVIFSILTTLGYDYRVVTRKAA